MSSKTGKSTAVHSGQHAIWEGLPTGSVEDCLGALRLLGHFATWFRRVSDIKDRL